MEDYEELRIPRQEHEGRSSLVDDRGGEEDGGIGEIGNEEEVFAAAAGRENLETVPEGEEDG